MKKDVAKFYFNSIAILAIKTNPYILVSSVYKVC